MFIILLAASSQAVIRDKSQWLSAHSHRSRSQSIFRPAALTTSSNTYIAMAMDDDGAFTIGTVTGDPGRSGDDNADLIFGHPSPGTSDTMVRIDGTNVSIHSGTSSGVSAITDGLAVTLTLGTTLQVEERLTIGRSQATGNNDVVQIYFKVTNIDSISHNVSLRTQLDTLLGSNDGAPFRIPGIGAVTTDREFDNDSLTTAADIPLQSLVLDDLVTANIISLFTFRVTGYQVPDRVVFGWWPVSVNSYDYTVVPGRSFLDNDGDGTIDGSSPDSDSSVLVYWGYPDPNAFTLAPGASKEFVILYGIGNCSSLSAPPLSVLFCAPAEISGQALGSSYQYTPVTISAFFSNTGGSAISNARAILNLSPDFKLESGYAGTRDIESSTGSGSLGASAETQIDWQLSSTGRYLGTRLLSLGVDLGSSRSSVLRSIVVKTIANLLYGQATDASGTPMAGATITVLQGSTVVGTATTQADGTYAVQNLAPGEYTVRLSATGYPDSYFQAVVSATTDSSRTGNPGAFATASNLTSYSYPNPVREGQARIAFFTSNADAAEIKIFTSAGRLIQTLQLNTTGAGWHEVEWPIDHVANGVYFYQVSAGKNYSRGKIAVIKRQAL